MPGDLLLNVIFTISKSDDKVLAKALLPSLLMALCTKCVQAGKIHSIDSKKSFIILDKAMSFFF